MTNYFILPWGHMTVTLEDVVRITGLLVHGEPVPGTTEENYKEAAQQLLGYEGHTGRPLTSVLGSKLTEMLGANGLTMRSDEKLDQYVERVKKVMEKKWVKKEGHRARRQRRLFYFLLFTRVLFATKGSSIS